MDSTPLLCLNLLLCLIDRNLTLLLSVGSCTNSVELLEDSRIGSLLPQEGPHLFLKTLIFLIQNIELTEDVLHVFKHVFKMVSLLQYEEPTFPVVCIRPSSSPLHPHLTSVTLLPNSSCLGKFRLFPFAALCNQNKSEPWSQSRKAVARGLINL